MGPELGRRSRVEGDLSHPEVVTGLYQIGGTLQIPPSRVDHGEVQCGRGLG